MSKRSIQRYIRRTIMPAMSSIETRTSPPSSRRSLLYLEMRCELLITVPPVLPSRGPCRHAASIPKVQYVPRFGINAEVHQLHRRVTTAIPRQRGTGNASRRADRARGCGGDILGRLVYCTVISIYQRSGTEYSTLPPFQPFSSQGSSLAWAIHK